MNPSSHIEENYNKKHAVARNCVERCNGVLKSRFRCLHRHRVLTYSPTQASHIINSCAVLHNMCIERRIPYEIDEFCNEDSDDEEEYDTATNSPTLAAARVLRNRVASAMI
ncbi:putative nuclease HARBI1, partial [Stegodyphus mimosarum]